MMTRTFVIQFIKFMYPSNSVCKYAKMYRCTQFCLIDCDYIKIIKKCTKVVTINRPCMIVAAWTNRKNINNILAAQLSWPLFLDAGSGPTPTGFSKLMTRLTIVAPGIAHCKMNGCSQSVSTHQSQVLITSPRSSESSTFGV